MIRRRGVSFLSTALVFLVFGALTILWLPGTPFTAFDDVRVDRAVPMSNVQPVEGAQKVFGTGATAGGAPARLGEGSLAESPDGGDTAGAEDGPVRLDEGSPAESTDGEDMASTRQEIPVKPDEGSSAENLDGGGTGDRPQRTFIEMPATLKTDEPPAETPPPETSHGTTNDDPELPSETLATHPIARLVQKTTEESEALLSRQSTTLEDAVAEYRRRYGMSPPPHFDKWFAFAQARNITLIDEFDTVHDMLTPFWGLKPSTIRRRATEALGYANNVQGLLVRDGKVALQSGGKDWEREALREILGGFAEWLPDMDLVFNALDEPRVVLPHEDLSHLIERGREAKGRVTERPANAFTKHAEDLGDGYSIPEVSTSRFVYVGRQSAWAVARMSCPADSPARSLDDDISDDTSHCAPDSPLCFVANTTAQTDICASPSLAYTYGFFDRPNSLSVSHDLLPVFSASKLSSFQDIVFPALWYWTGRVPYNESADVSWAEKRGQLFWRGSTTGGFSRWGGWRRHHRQRAVLRLNSDDPTTVLSHHPPNISDAHWETQTSSVSHHASLLNISFTHVGQCDPGDCAAQRTTLPLAPTVPQHAAFAYRFLLDMDGNAFSGRFQTFLRSASLVLKVAMFREWSPGWIVPWRDYVPLSLGGEEWVEAVRYLEGEGRGVAEGMAKRDGVGRGEMEVWVFRLLLEYARVVDDDREKIGFSLES